MDSAKKQKGIDMISKCRACQIMSLKLYFLHAKNMLMLFLMRGGKGDGSEYILP